QSALQTGTTLSKLLEVVSRFRERSQIPLILFSAYNPFHKFGLEKVAQEARSAGADGFLAGDLPVEESEEFRSICLENDLCLIYLVAPTSPPERKKLIASKASGFLYYVSLKGVTGARDKVATDLGRQIEELRKFSTLPIAVGFGVSKPEHVQTVSEHADAVVVGSALIDCVARNVGSRRLASEVEKFVRSLSAPLHGLPV
ncbi:MAG: tryptophan synthase subunit alpha, partial [bacterium]